MTNEDFQYTKELELIKAKLALITHLTSAAVAILTMDGNPDVREKAAAFLNSMFTENANAQ